MNMDLDAATKEAPTLTLDPFAEAKAELGQCTQDVLDETINVLRDRVDMPHLTVNPEMDPKYAKYGLDA